MKKSLRKIIDQGAIWQHIVRVCHQILGAVCAISSTWQKHCTHTYGSNYFSQWFFHFQTPPSFFSLWITDWEYHIFQCIPKLWMVDHKVDGGCFVFGNHTPFFHPAGNLNIVKAFGLYKGKLIIFVGICVCHGCLYAGPVFLVGKQKMESAGRNALESLRHMQGNKGE